MRFTGIPGSPMVPYICSLTYSSALNFPRGFNSPMICTSAVLTKACAMYGMFNGASVCWIDAHFTLDKAPSHTAAHVLSSYSRTPTHAVVYCRVPCFAFLQVQFLGKFKKEISSFREEWFCCLSAIWLVAYIYASSLCCELFSSVRHHVALAASK